MVLPTQEQVVKNRDIELLCTLFSIVKSEYGYSEYSYYVSDPVLDKPLQKLTRYIEFLPSWSGPSNTRKRQAIKIVLMEIPNADLEWREIF